MRNYQDLARGDIESVKESLMTLAKLEAEVYEKTYGHETGTKFATNISKANEIYDKFQATNKLYK